MAEIQLLVAHSHSMLPPETDGLMYQFQVKELCIERWHQSWKGTGILESPVNVHEYSDSASPSVSAHSSTAQ